MNGAQKIVLTMLVLTLSFAASAARAANPNATTTDVPYQFLNNSAAGPVVTGYITITSVDPGGSQNYVTANLAAGASNVGKVTMAPATLYSIAAKGFITTGAGINCGPVQYIQMPTGRWDKKSQVVAVYSHADDAALFSCTLTVISR